MTCVICGKTYRHTKQLLLPLEDGSQKLLTVIACVACFDIVSQTSKSAAEDLILDWLFEEGEKIYLTNSHLTDIQKTEQVLALYKQYAPAWYYESLSQLLLGGYCYYHESSSCYS